MLHFHSIHHHRRTAFSAVLSLVLGLSLSGARGADDWVRVSGVDGKVSALFPTDIRKNPQKDVESTAAGKVETNFGNYEGDGILITGSGSGIPGMASMLVGESGIFTSSKKRFLKKAAGTEVSFSESTISGAPARTLIYTGSGYKGKAVFVLVNKRMYIVNSVMTKDTAANQAIEKKLFGSIQVNK